MGTGTPTLKHFHWDGVIPPASPSTFPLLYLSSIFPVSPKHPPIIPKPVFLQNRPIIPLNSLLRPSATIPAFPQQGAGGSGSGLTLKRRNAAIQQLRLCSSSLQSSFRPFTPLRTLWGCGRGRSRHGGSPRVALRGQRALGAGGRRRERPRRGQGHPHLDAEAELGGSPVELLALGHVVDVGLGEVSEVLEVPGVLGGGRCQG